MNKPVPIYNFHDAVHANPLKYRQFAFDEFLITEFSCPLESPKQAIWSSQNYFVYVLDGKKAFHTVDGVHVMEKDNCAFVRRGASLVEQFFDSEFCVVVFFITDEFICDVLRPLLGRFPTEKAAGTHVVFPLETDATLAAFFHSMLPYFGRMQPPEKALLELKFRELLLNIASNPQNRDLMAYFCSLQHTSTNARLQEVMETNFHYNLSLDTFAQLCNCSLSTFKREFQKIYQTTPGKWLLAKRLERARILLQNPVKTVSEVAYESGFENLSHFSRVFRAHFGTAPVATRQKTAALTF